MRNNSFINTSYGMLLKCATVLIIITLLLGTSVYFVRPVSALNLPQECEGSREYWERQIRLRKEEIERIENNHRSTRDAALGIMNGTIGVIAGDPIPDARNSLAHSRYRDLPPHLVDDIIYAYVLADQQHVIDPIRTPSKPGANSLLVAERQLGEIRELKNQIHRIKSYIDKCFEEEEQFEEKEEEGVKKEEEDERREGIGPPSPVSYRLYAGKLELFEGHGALVGILLWSNGAVDSTPQNLEVLNYSEDFYVNDILPFGEFEKFTLSETSEGHSASGTVEIEILPNGVQIKYDLSTEGSPTKPYVTAGGAYTGCTLVGGLVPAVYALEVEYWPGEGGRKRDVIIEIEENVTASGTGKGEFEVLVNVHRISSLSECPTGPDFLTLEPVEPGRSVLIDGRDIGGSERFMVEFMVFGNVFASALLSTTHAPDEFGEASGMLIIQIYDELSDED